MSGKTAVVYWDTSAFLALLKGEMSHGIDAYNALLSQAGAFDRGEIILATSMVGIAEVLSADIGDSVREQFEKMIRRKNFQSITVNDTIARQAATLKQHCYQRAKARGNGDPHVLTMPDALHIVTAMRIEADVLVTLDRDNKNVEVKRRELGMAQITQFYPVPDLYAVRIELPSLGLPGTGLAV